MAVFFTILTTAWLILLAIEYVRSKYQHQRQGLVVLMGVIAIPWAISLAIVING